MANLKHVDRRLLESLLGMGSGYVLDFTDISYATFFRDYGIDIERNAYHRDGRSKAKRMRVFWEIDSDPVVGNVLEGLFNYIIAVNPKEAGGPVEERHWEIIRRLLGKKFTSSKIAHTEQEFLELEFGNLDISCLSLGPGIENTVCQRLHEIKLCLQNDVPLAAILLAGSTLEGLLLDTALKNPKDFNQSISAGKADGKVAQFHEWSLNDLINVAHETGLIGLDVKKYSHALRDFRNYIHPFQQASCNFAPDAYTARISWQVLRAAIADLVGRRKH